MEIEIIVAIISGIIGLCVFLIGFWVSMRYDDGRLKYASIALTVVALFFILGQIVKVLILKGLLNFWLVGEIISLFMVLFMFSAVYDVYLLIRECKQVNKK